MSCWGGRSLDILQWRWPSPNGLRKRGFHLWNGSTLNATESLFERSFPSVRITFLNCLELQSFPSHLKFEARVGELESAGDVCKQQFATGTLTCNLATLLSPIAKVVCVQHEEPLPTSGENKFASAKLPSCRLL